MRQELQASAATSIEKAIGTLWGAAVGDAMGWPYEARANPLKGDGPQKRGLGLEAPFKAWVKRSGGRFRPHQEAIASGEYSDDTQLLIAVARARTSSTEWWKRLAEAEFPLWTVYERGGGGATLRATKSLLKGDLPWEARAAATVDKYFQAGGNGVAMRIAPHCLAHADATEFYGLAQDIMSDGVLTHGHPRALVGALAYGFCLWWALQNTDTLRYGELIRATRRGARDWGDIPDISDRWPTWSKCAQHFDFATHWREAVEEQVRALDLIDEAVAAGALAIDRETLAALGCFDRRINGSGTVNAAAAIFLASRHAASPREGIQRAAKATGADTDTLASMTGALLGAVDGAEWLLPYVSMLQDGGLIRELAERTARGDQNELAHHVFKSRDAAKLIEDIRSGRSQLDVPGFGTMTPVPHDGVRSLSAKFEALSWKAELAGQTIFIKQLNEKKAELPLPVATKPNSGTFSGVALNVVDLVRARRFYEDFMGLTVTRVADKFVRLGQLALRVGVVEPKANAITIFVEVADLRLCQKVLAEHGLDHSEILVRSGRDTLICRDPDGNLVEIVQRA